MQQWKKHWVILLRGGLGIGTLVFIFRYAAGLRSTIELLSSTRLPIYCTGLALAAIGELVTSVKWQQLIRTLGYSVRLGKLYRFSLIGMFYNNLLPGTLGGDVARTLLTRTAAGGTARAGAAIFMQRNTGLAGLLIVANIASWLPPIRFDEQDTRVISYLGFWFALVTVAYIIVNVLMLHPGLYRMIWQKQMLERESIASTRLLYAMDVIRRFHHGSLAMVGALVWPIVLSVATQLIDCTIVFIASLALGLNLPFQYFLVFVPVTTLAALLPISINGIGLREGLYLLLLRSQGVTSEAAVAIALLHFSYIILLALTGGLLQLMPTSEVSVATEQDR